MNRILSMLRSPGAMIVALVAILAAQGEHTAQVIAYFSHSGGEPLAYAFAFAIEVAVLLFVMNGHKRISYGFAVATFFTNVIYYAIGGVALLSIAIAPVLLLSVLPPAAIVGYSHTIADKPMQGATPAAPAPAKTRRYRWQFWRKPAETPAELPTPNDTTPAPIVAPSPSGGHSEAAGKSRKPRTVAKAGKTVVPPETKAIILNAVNNGATVPDVASEFSISPNTVRSWIARAPKQTNGVH